jgi:hypothetical protein
MDWPDAFALPQDGGGKAHKRANVPANTDFNKIVFNR